jgi:hypothetical protein
VTPKSLRRRSLTAVRPVADSRCDGVPRRSVDVGTLVTGIRRHPMAIASVRHPGPSLAATRCSTSTAAKRHETPGITSVACEALRIRALRRRASGTLPGRYWKPRRDFNLPLQRSLPRLTSHAKMIELAGRSERLSPDFKSTRELPLAPQRSARRPRPPAGHFRTLYPRKFSSARSGRAATP